MQIHNAYTGPYDHLQPCSEMPTRKTGKGRDSLINSGHGMTFEIYKDQRGEWRWRLMSKNGKKIGDSGEGYKRRGHARRMAEKIIAGPHKIVFV